VPAVSRTDESHVTTSILGNRVVRTEDPRLLTSGGTYVGDIPLEGAAWVTFVRASMAHARISIDVRPALEAPGVLAIVTAADLDLGSYPVDLPMVPTTMPRPFLADGVVRFVGEPLAAVVSETRPQGEDAAEMVVVDYDPLPVVVDPEAALADDVLLHPEAGSNVCVEFPAGPEPDWSQCDVVVRDRIVNQRVAPCPLEVRAAASSWGQDGRLTHWASTQGAHPIRDLLATMYGLDQSQVRVITPDVGGGFGAKLHYPEEMICPWLARRTGRPVRWTETRTESMLGLVHGRAQIQDLAIGGTNDGRVLGYQLTVLQDAGAYPRIGAILPFLTMMMLTGTYNIPVAAFSSRSVVTNTVPTGAYRGAGRPEAAAAIERAMDLFAREIDMDPAEVRRRNLIPPEAFPFTTPMGTTYDSGRYAYALDLVLAEAGYAGLRAEQARRRQAGDTKLLGIGLSVYVEITAFGGGGEYGRVEVLPSGRVKALTGTSPHGQGHYTAWAMLISDRLGIPLDQIEVFHGDTDLVPVGGLTGGSRSAQLGGTNIWRAAGAVVDQARNLAATLLEADPADVVLDTSTGRFHVAGTPSISQGWAEVAAAAEAEGSTLSGEGDFSQSGGTFPSGAHVAVVEVDAETGKVSLIRMVAADDAGRILNPLLAEGQVHGGLAQGAAQALLEEVVYDVDGNPLTSNLADYAFISAAELPSFETVHVETATPLNELGAKGIGESGTIGATPAVHNAVIDALAHLGVRHVDMPATSERVWRAITKAESRT
jgi:carbon-monoxide dehydrogenase large subunit